MAWYSCEITVKAGVVLDIFPLPDKHWDYTERKFIIPADTMTSTTISISATCAEGGVFEVYVDDAECKVDLRL